MAALELRPDSDLTPLMLDEFLEQQGDLGTKWSPRYVRITESLPVTETKKILKKQLRQQYWQGNDQIWWRPKRNQPLQPMSENDRIHLTNIFSEQGRLSSLAL
jgi:fatty-acyl-CoA synthase